MEHSHRGVDHILTQTCNGGGKTVNLLDTRLGKFRNTRIGFSRPIDLTRQFTNGNGQFITDDDTAYHARQNDQQNGNPQYQLCAIDNGVQTAVIDQAQQHPLLRLEWGISVIEF